MKFATAILVILAENPVIKPTLFVLSGVTVGGSTRTIGGVVYPKPGFVITEPVSHHQRQIKLQLQFHQLQYPL